MMVSVRALLACAAAGVFVVGCQLSPSTNSEGSEDSAAAFSTNGLPLGSNNPNEADQPGTSIVVAEINREVSSIQETHYQHAIHVQESDGVYDVDCSGFVDYVLAQSAPDHFSSLTAATRGRPLAADFVSFFASGDSLPDDWAAVTQISDLMPGDIVAWLSDAGSDQSGHVMVVSDVPQLSADGSSYTVPIWDSTDTPHGKNDARRLNGTTGIGNASIVLYPDDNDAPTAFGWAPGDAMQTQTIGLGRPL